VFDETRVIRTPLRGIIAGYHVLALRSCSGLPSTTGRRRQWEVRGRIRVSPRLVLGGKRADLR